MSIEKWKPGDPHLWDTEPPTEEIEEVIKNWLQSEIQAAVKEYIDTGHLYVTMDGDVTFHAPEPLDSDDRFECKETLEEVFDQLWNEFDAFPNADKLAKVHATVAGFAESLKKLIENKDG